MGVYLNLKSQSLLDILPNTLKVADDPVLVLVLARREILRLVVGLQLLEEGGIYLEGFGMQ